MPWIGFSNDPDGKARPCCLYKGHVLENTDPMYVQKYSVNEIFSSKYMVDLREKFRNGEQPAECSTCWIDENNGFKSKRLFTNEIWKHAPFDPMIEPTAPIEFQMIINNSCNLKCRSCTPSHSTQWQIENLKITGDSGYKMPYGQAGDDDSVLWTKRLEWYDSVQRLEIVGGEPFYVKQWHQIFEELILTDRAKNISVNLSSNCSLFFGDLLEKMANNFKFVGIGLSVDGTGSEYEYLRNPGNWETVYGNMKKYHDMMKRYTNLNVQVSYTIGWLNALDLPIMHELLKTDFPKFKIWNNIIHYPEHMAICSATDEIKKAITDAWNNYEWDPQNESIIEGVETYMNSKSVTDLQFMEYVQILLNRDSIRNENLYESFPKLTSFLPKR
jgi:MoaA/NifB/PqqE/SkfB family radical SAM enzyme